MKNRQQEIPLFTPDVWERMELSQKKQVIQVMAEMIKQAIQNPTKEGHNYELTERPENQ